MRVCIVPGYGAGPNDHWFGWLRQEIERDAQVSFVSWPDPLHPKAGKWLDALREQVGDVDEETFFVAHSLGCIALCRYLDTLPPECRLGGLVMVSGFVEPPEAFPKLEAFTEPAPDFARVARRASGRVSVVAAADDVSVPAASTRALAEALGARFTLLPRGGHFHAVDGFDKFPLVREELEMMSKHGAG